MTILPQKVGWFGSKRIDLHPWGSGMTWVVVNDDKLTKYTLPT